MLAPSQENPSTLQDFERAKPETNVAPSQKHQHSFLQRQVAAVEASTCGPWPPPQVETSTAIFIALPPEAEKATRTHCQPHYFTWK